MQLRPIRAVDLAALGVRPQEDDPFGLRAIRMTAVRHFLARDLVVTLAGRYHIWPA